MKATKADIIVALAKTIQGLHDEFYMIDHHDFPNYVEFLKEQDKVEDKVNDLYQDIREVLSDQSLDN